MRILVVPVAPSVTTVCGTACTLASVALMPNTSEVIAGNIAATLTALLTIFLQR
jgi:hypothetical protein